MADIKPKTAIMNLDKEMYPEMNFLLNTAESDVKFVINGEEVPAIKAVLRLKSDVFSVQFSGNWRDSEDTAVEIVDTTPEAFKVMLGFIYTEQLVFNDNKDVDHIHHVLKLSEKYQLKRLKKLVIQHILSILTVHNIQLVGQLAFDYELDELIAAVKTLIDENFKQLLKKSPKDLNDINNACNNLLIEKFSQHFNSIDTMFSVPTYDKTGNTINTYKIGQYTCTYNDNNNTTTSTNSIISSSSSSSRSTTIKAIDINNVPKLCN
ncbi:speckle-type POZ protein-like [Oppia nitens]|uniref:speckle-type POZ protein-like n=1 Tax=Oppia nitens TaxID=1686743 RepID=UPI0023DCE7F5|nr:speckle-type POZ protein-like [Oppia nitens]